ncbi:unnamed protein product [Brassicogethes aeneus]|uniref:3'-5' exonuclease n=1 Tax=Brassicogethes aeneus TaxID=1431903 RepID=A0A9P0BFT8_BRAAE|nr:unnamed protein product [Brassicogethes aeneus]
MTTKRSMRLRSAVDPLEKENIAKRQKLEKTEYEKRPFITYKGKCMYYTTLVDCAIACDELLQQANRSEEEFVVGFDLEWPFNFQTGPGKVAVIQISPTLDKCYILHVSEMKKLPKSLSEFLEHPKVIITGVNIKNDVRKLARDFPGFNSDKMVENCFDSGVMAKNCFPTSGRYSLEKLVNRILKMKINKDKKVRMSKWHIIPLSEAQQKYAAIDAYASLLLYYKIKEAEEIKAIKDKEDDEKHPEVLKLLN